MKNIVFILFMQFSLYLNAQVDERIEYVVMQMRSIHGVDVGEIRKRYKNDKPEIRLLLQAIFKYPERYYSDMPAGDHKPLTYNALVTFGYFVNFDKDSGLDDVDFKYYQELLDYSFKKNDKELRSAIYSSLKATGSYEALELLNSSFDRENELYLKQQILENATIVLNGPVKIEPVGDLVYVPQFDSGLDKPFYERQNADWEEIINVFMKHQKEWWQEVPSRYRKEAALKDMYAEFDEKFKKAKKYFDDDNKSNKKTSFNNGGMNNQNDQGRSISSIDHGDDHSGPIKNKVIKRRISSEDELSQASKDYSKWLMGIIAVIGLFILAVIIRIKRRRYW